MSENNYDESLIRLVWQESTALNIWYPDNLHMRMLCIDAKRIKKKQEKREKNGVDVGQAEMTI